MIDNMTDTTTPDFDAAATPAPRGRGRPRLTDEQIAAMPPERRRRHDAYMRVKYYDSLPPEERERAARMAQSQAGRESAAKRRRLNKGGRTVNCSIREKSLEQVRDFAQRRQISIPMALYDIIEAGIVALGNTPVK